MQNDNFRLPLALALAFCLTWALPALAVGPPSDENSTTQQDDTSEYLIIDKKTPSKKNEAATSIKRQVKPQYGEIIIEPDSDTEE